MNTRHKEANQTTNSMNDSNDKSKQAKEKSKHDKSEQTKENPTKDKQDSPNEISSATPSTSNSVPQKRGRKKKEASLRADQNISRMRTRNSQSRHDSESANI